MRSQPFTLMSPRTDSTQHMAHQRAAADAARLQRLRPADAQMAVPSVPPRTPHVAAATPRRGPPAGSERPAAAAAADEGVDDVTCSPVAGDAALEAQPSGQASPDAESVLQGGPCAVSPEALDFLGAASSDDKAGTGARKLSKPCYICNCIWQLP